MNKKVDTDGTGMDVAVGVTVGGAVAVAVGGTGVEVGGSVGTAVGVGGGVGVPQAASTTIDTLTSNKRRDRVNILLLAE